MNKEQPEISVVMSVFNGEEFLSEAINSILEQSFNNYEFIIIDDASTDKTANILLEFQNKDKRIKIINNTNNMGLAKSLNIAISLAKGKFIARMDADDFSFPDRLKIQYQHMMNYPDTIVCGTAMSIYEEPNNNKTPPLSHDKIISSIIFDCPFYHPTVMMRKDILLKLDPIYPEDYKKAQDYGLWAKLFFMAIDNNHKFINLSDVLLKYRIHPDKNRTHYYSEQRFYAALSQLKIMSTLGIKIDIDNLIKINSSNKLSANEIIELDKILKDSAKKMTLSSSLEYKKNIYDVVISKRFKLYSRAKTNELLGIALKTYSRFLYLTNRKKIKSLL
ncbi:glycosyltransferase family 2 protein [Xenorhabdus doucetiae]|uniref:Glycosyl transferase family 2 n=1 Tax=Xenorhabdus doucetiae TaxID=351671 RepID=A0A068QM17_9GAMM|nr:glycosyltransferase family 2 protein [Xenorhabdus doucetiae]TYP07832.1 glycosyl transferase family 2 [Xenorhabdus doucetiae]CDG15852.1 WenB [Xenorhabdus doucetiae]